MRSLTYPLEFIVTQRRLEQVTQLIVEVGGKVPTIVATNACDLVSYAFLDFFLLVHRIDIQGWHDVAAALCWLQV